MEFGTVITCAENDQVVLPVLPHGAAHASLGAAADIQRVVAALRGKFPDLRILVRADSGYAVPRFYQACEESFLEEESKKEESKTATFLRQDGAFTARGVTCKADRRGEDERRGRGESCAPPRVE